MKVIKIKQVPKGPSWYPQWFVGSILQQRIIDDPALSKYFRIGQANLGRGGRNKFHSHSIEQILIPTKGKGIVATDKEEATVGPGDIIVILPGEKHWHGATQDSTFSFIYILSRDQKTTWFEE